MIAFDSFFEPFVWMNADFTKNEYKREHISEEDFTYSILQILLRNGDKFEEKTFSEKCTLARGNQYNLSEMALFFKNCEESEAQESSIDG